LNSGKGGGVARGGMGAITPEREDGQEAVTHELEDLASMAVDAAGTCGWGPRRVLLVPGGG